MTLSRGTRAFWVGVFAVAALGTMQQAAAQRGRNQPEQTQPTQTPEQIEAARRAAELEKQREALLSGLQQGVQKLRDEERKLSQAREGRFRAELQKQEKRAADATARRNAAEARSNALNKEWDSNEKTIAEDNELLKDRTGNLGELFGVTRQIAGDAANTLSESPLSIQFEEPAGGDDRVDFLRRIAAAKALPSIAELDRLWYELMREMTEGGKVVKTEAPVQQEDGMVKNMPVVRIGPFTAESNGEYLGYLPSKKMYADLGGQVQERLRNIGIALQNAPPTGYVRAIVDPSSGALFSMYVERPGLIRRIQEGQVVGYVIVAVGVIGVLVAFVQAIYLVATRLAVSAQLRNLQEPKRNNPLGRVLLAFKSGGSRDESAQLAELRISEAVLREVPKLERFQSFLRLAVAAGPLLGLIGTVIGMIITFRAIVASGTSDPKIMAHGIGQAMIATVLGLAVAIPLLFINAGLAAMSRGVTQILDEQSQALLAENTGHRKQQTV